MYLQPIHTADSILARAQEVEVRARVRLLTREEANRMVSVARVLRDIATRIRRIIKAWSREALPSKYGWSGAEFTQWFMTTTPGRDPQYLLRRQSCPSSVRSFVGIECAVEGVDRYTLLTLMGRSNQRVLSLDDQTTAYLLNSSYL